MSNYEVVIKKVEPLRVASLRRILPQPQAVSRLFEELFTCLQQQGIRPAGAPGAIWHDTEHKESDWDTEAVVPVQGGQAGDGVRVIELPEVPSMACTIHQGSYELLPEAYAALMEWIAANGYEMAGPMREFYLRGPSPEGGDPAEYITEIQVPVSK